MIDIGVPMRACGSFGDLPLTINAAGQVVLNFCADVCSAYLWDRGALTKLGGLSGDQATVFGINPRGWMVGQITGSGEANAVLWTP